jgi:uncharacterized membrane protein YedE/YeeE
MPEVDVDALARTVVVSAFVLGVVFGAISQRTNFCTMGSIADVFSFGDYTRLRQWLLAIAVAVLGTNLLGASGLIDTADSFYTAPRLLLLSHLVGGVLFGVGMVLAGGCPSRTLVRVGGGNLKSLIVAIVIGVVGYLSLRGLLAVFRVDVLEPASIVLPTRQDLPSLLAAAGIALPTAQAGAAAIVAAALLVFVFRDRSFLRFDNLLAGFGIGAIIVAAWYVSGVIGHLAEHPRTLEEAFVGTSSGRMESLSFVAPIAYALEYLMLFSDTSRVVTLGIAAVAGAISGSLLVAVVSSSFRWEGFRDTEDTANHLVGGALMGFGGVTALGCTIGQGLSGISTLALGSLLTLAAIVAGAILGLKYQSWRIERVA